MNVALIELSSSHDECLYTQIKLLKSKENVDVTLIINERLAEPVSYYDIDVNMHFVKSRKGFNGLIDNFQLKQFLLDQKFDFIIFNTASGKAIRNLLLMMPKREIKYIGTIHNTSKLKKSTTQKYISKYIKRYFVLNDYLKAEASYYVNSNIKIGSYYPIHFPKYPTQSMQKNNNDIWICIPGQVETKRRDYDALLDQIECYGLRKNIKLILLGQSNHTEDGLAISQRIKKLEIGDQVQMWNGFIETATFYQYIQASDYILPLIHWDHASGQLYLHQITGAFNLAYGYQIPLLMEGQFCKQIQYRDPIIPYNHDQLVNTINQLPLSHIKQSYPSRLDFDEQAMQYWKLILS